MLLLLMDDGYWLTCAHLLAVQEKNKLMCEKVELENQLVGLHCNRSRGQHFGIAVFTPCMSSSGLCPRPRARNGLNNGCRNASKSTS